MTTRTLILRKPSWRTVELGSRIDQLRIVAFGLPAFDQIMADIFTTEKKE